MQEQNKQLVIDFLHTLETRSKAEDLQVFYHPEVEQTEFPNAILSTKTTRDLNTLIEGAEKGAQILQKEEYQIQNLYAFDDKVILEAIWKGTLSIPIGKLSPGDQMIAYFAQFFEIRDGKIFRQRNYDCFEPFS